MARRGTLRLLLLSSCALQRFQCQVYDEGTGAYTPEAQGSSGSSWAADSSYDETGGAYASQASGAYAAQSYGRGSGAGSADGYYGNDEGVGEAIGDGGDGGGDGAGLGTYASGDEYTDAAESDDYAGPTVAPDALDNYAGPTVAPDAGASEDYYNGPTVPPGTTGPPPTTTVTTVTTPYPLHGGTTMRLGGTQSLHEVHQQMSSKKVKKNLPRAVWQDPHIESAECTPRFRVRDAPPEVATDLNGVRLPPACFKDDSKGAHHVFVIGDWGGIIENLGTPPKPADHRAHQFAAHSRAFINGADNVAQLNVSKWMKILAKEVNPDYVINLGDNFYWAGINVQCGAPTTAVADPGKQWEWVWEKMYAGPGLDDKQWLGVLGNHDYGGFMFTNGWDQAITYTWANLAFTSKRWMTPALYYATQVIYSNFTVDYFFVDSNVFDAFDEHADQGHNICGLMHNYPGASCGISGPASTEECPTWFKNLWDAQVDWLENGLGASSADWQIVATHFPPEHGTDVWKRLGKEFGIDLLLTAHRHIQEVHVDDPANILSPTAFVVSGGGGGITSEGLPTTDGRDDQYGFMDLTMSKHEIKITAISHGGQIRSTHCITQRHKGDDHTQHYTGPSLCDDLGPYGTGTHPLPTAAPGQPIHM